MPKIIFLSTIILLSGCQFSDKNYVNQGIYSSFFAEKLRVIDGDTIEVSNVHATYRVRLVGIDAPESNQPHGKASTDNLFECTKDKNVIIKWKEKDKYNRILGTVYADGKDCNLIQIQTGYAWHYKYYQNEQPNKQRIEYSKAEIYAKKNKIGLWEEKCVQAPWDWRAKKDIICP